MIAIPGPLDAHLVGHVHGKLTGGDGVDEGGADREDEQFGGHPHDSRGADVVDPDPSHPRPPGLFAAQHELSVDFALASGPSFCRSRELRMTAMKILVVEDDPDVQFLIEAVFSMDDRFAVAAVAASAEEALETARTTEPGVIVLDHGLAGALTGIEAASRLKEVAPNAEIILFTAHAELRHPAADEPAIDAFLLKTDSAKLLPLAQKLTGMGVRPA